MANPYAPPGFDGGGFVPPGGPPAPGAPQPWEVGEVVKIAWEIIKRQPILVVVVFGVYLISNLPGTAANMLLSLRLIEADSPAFLLIGSVGALVGGLLSLFLQIGQLRLFVSAARGQQVDFGLLLSGGDRMLPMIGLTLMWVFAMLLGLVACIVGAVVVWLGLFLSQYYLVDARQGVIESLQTSWRVSKGNLLNLFLYFLVSAGLMFAGLLAFCVGLFVAMAVFMAGFAVIYLRSTGEMVVTGAAPPPGGVPAPGYPGAPGYPRGYQPGTMSPGTMA